MDNNANNNDGESQSTASMDVFLYAGYGGVPRDVTHVRVHASVRVIPEGAFKFCNKLQQIILAEGIEIVGHNAFYECASLTRISIPPTVNMICDRAFWMCGNLVEVDLQEGLKEIGIMAFSNCRSLNKIDIPSTVKVIGDAAFYKCESIEELELPEGMQYIGRRAFSCCGSLVRANVPSLVSVISYGTFQACIQLVDVRLSEGLQEIGKGAFFECSSLEKINIPTTVRVISEEAFKGCDHLTKMVLSDSVETIGESAFSSYNFQSIRVPPLVTKIDTNSFDACGGLFSIELPYNLKQLNCNRDRFPHLKFLRNIAIPSKCKLGRHVFNYSEASCVGNGRGDLGAIFQASRNNIGIMQTLKQGFDSFAAYKLRRRFDGLPMHEVCYYHSYHSTEDVIKALKKYMGVTGKQQDCLGMTPLHILACSTKQRVELYQLLLNQQPANLFTKDKWGDLPITYAFWNSVPQGVIRLLMEYHSNYFHDYELDWTSMIETLARANAPLLSIQNLLKTQQALFSEYHIDWDEIVAGIFDFIECGYNFETYKALFKLSIHEHLNSLSVIKWQEGVESELDRFLNKFPWLREKDLESLHSKIDHYQQMERVKEATSLLELALWKAKIVRYECGEETSQDEENCDAFMNREQCRFNCGADVVLPNVIPFLLPIFYQKNPFFISNLALITGCKRYETHNVCPS